MFSPVLRNQFGTIYTPPDVVSLTIDEAIKKYNGDLRTAIFCDPACGDGNFLIAIYQLLIRISEISDPLERSLDALNRIYGIEILGHMAAASNARLLLGHCQNLPIANAKIIIDQHIFHGNTLRTINDDWPILMYEGGLLPQWLQNMKFDIIVGNPPYTQYKKHGKGDDLPVPAAYKQPNLALSFWQWCHNHTTGVYSLNIKDMVLNSVSGKLRTVLAPYLSSIVYCALTREYSSVNTLIMTGGHNRGPQCYNDMPLTIPQTENLIRGRFIRNMSTQSSLLPGMIPLHSCATIGKRLRGGGRGAPLSWADHSFTNAEDGHYIIFCYIINPSATWPQFKYLTVRPEVLAPMVRVGKAGKSHLNYAEFKDAQEAKLIWCFLNSRYNLQYNLQLFSVARVTGTTKCLPKCLRITLSDMKQILVPNYNDYHTREQEKLQAVLNFADQHSSIEDFCAGADRVINHLLFDNPDEY